MITEEQRRRVQRALAETIVIIQQYRVKDPEWLQMSGEGAIMARYEQHRDKLLAILAEASQGR